ncbi:MAG: hypothetical protein IJR26_11465 [Bacteroidales bacterium]|nr:hypothetical protein [Bacteroidales bacterium]
MRYVDRYHVQCKKQHNEAKRRKRKKEWLRNTPLYIRGLGQVSAASIPIPEYDDEAPVDFRFLVNTKECAVFFKRIRKAGASGIRHYRINMENVQHIDFASTMMLSAIGEELLNNGCALGGNSPKRPECERYLKESGFFNKLFDQNRRRFASSTDSEFITVERGQYKLTSQHYRAFRELVRHIKLHLLGQTTNTRMHNTIIKEICANSVEWSEADKSQWTLGAKFESDKVIIVALDLGRGILEKLFIDYWEHLKNLISFKTDANILFGAFEQKYGSTALESNRNRGLPCVKAAMDDGYIKDLKVVTNNSIIDFLKGNNTMFAKHRGTFNGTLYSWRIDKNCIL